jgi:hypothetical protein
MKSLQEPLYYQVWNTGKNTVPHILYPSYYTLNISGIIYHTIIHIYIYNL